MKLNTNSNIYTFVYMTVVVIIVAVLLALANQSLLTSHSSRVKKLISCSTSRNRSSVRSRWTTPPAIPQRSTWFLSTTR